MATLKDLWADQLKVEHPVAPESQPADILDSHHTCPACHERITTTIRDGGSWVCRCPAMRKKQPVKRGRVLQMVNHFHVCTAANPAARQMFGHWVVFGSPGPQKCEHCIKYTKINPQKLNLSK